MHYGGGALVIVFYLFTNLGDFCLRAGEEREEGVFLKYQTDNAKATPVHTRTVLVAGIDRN